MTFSITIVYVRCSGQGCVIIQGQHWSEREGGMDGKNEARIERRREED